MAKIAYLATGMLSRLNSSLGLCEQLASRGHHISYLAPVDLATIVTRHRFDFVLLTADQIHRQRAQQLSRPSNLLSLPRWLLKKRALRLDSLRSTEIEDSLRKLDPDLLIIDTEFHFAVISTASLSIPTLLHQNWFCYHKHGNNPPINSTLAGHSENLTKIKTAWKAVDQQTRQLNAFRFNKGTLLKLLQWVSTLTTELPPLRALAKEKKFPLTKEVDIANFLRPFSYRNLPIISTSLLELEFLTDFPQNFHHLGPIFGSHFGKTPDPDSLRAWNTFQAKHLAAPSPPKLLYATLGTFWETDRDFLHRLIHVLEKRTDWTLVLGLGSKSNPADLGPLPENVLALSWAPQQEILALADCALIHCGPSTLYECIFHNVPILAYSTKQVDQNGNAARLRFHQLAHLGDKDTDTPVDIENNISTTLADSLLQKQSSVFRDHILRYHQRQTAATTVETFLPNKTMT